MYSKVLNQLKYNTMDHLLSATMKVDVAIRKQERRLAEKVYAEDDNQFEIGRRRGLEDAYEILVEQLKEKQPEVVSQLNALRRIINKM